MCRQIPEVGTLFPSRTFFAPTVAGLMHSGEALVMLKLAPNAKGFVVCSGMLYILGTMGQLLLLRNHWDEPSSTGYEPLSVSCACPSYNDAGKPHSHLRSWVCTEVRF